MLCDCGFSFFNAKTKKPRRHKSYTVIDDKDYRTFIKIEMKAWQGRSKEARLSAVARAAQYVGSLHRCPKCGAYTFLKPNSSTREHLTQVK